MIEGSSTALGRKRITAPFRWLIENEVPLNEPGLDFGCGRSIDAEVYGWDKYDPCWFPEYPQGIYRTITCTYVLNVIPIEKQIEVLQQIREVLHSSQGHAYISVRRDLKQDRPGRGCVQRLVKLVTQPIYTKVGSFAIYDITPQNMREVVSGLQQQGI